MGPAPIAHRSTTTHVTAVRWSRPSAVGSDAWPPCRDFHCRSPFAPPWRPPRCTGHCTLPLHHPARPASQPYVYIRCAARPLSPLPGPSLALYTTGPDAFHAACPPPPAQARLAARPRVPNLSYLGCLANAHHGVKSEVGSCVTPLPEYGSGGRSSRGRCVPLNTPPLPG